MEREEKKDWSLVLVLVLVLNLVRTEFELLHYVNVIKLQVLKISKLQKV
jgi:hypothetical protein